MKRVFLFALPVLISGCQTITEDRRAAVDLEVGSLISGSPEWRGLKLARNRCSDCHAVEAGRSSALPRAPSFAAISRTSGLTRTSLTNWMRGHRPLWSDMFFEIPAEHIDDLVAYIITLKPGDGSNATYRRAE
jgi:cytochrome c553